MHRERSRVWRARRPLTATPACSRRRRRLVPSRLALPLLALAVLASSGPLASAAPASPASVTVLHCGFVDSSRTVPDYATQPPSIFSRARPLPTTIWLPPPGGPVRTRPLILFAAGYDSYPSVYAPLLTAWARAGFVVAAPTFPDENPAAVSAQRANTEGDLANEPADLAYVGRALEAASARRNGACPAVFGRIEPSALVVAGHSDGAIAAALFAFGTGADPQGAAESTLRAPFPLRAALIFSGAEDGLGPYGAPDPHLPLLMVQSAGDHCNPERDAVGLYRAIGVDERFFLLLASAPHRSPFDGTNKPAFNLVAATSVRFLRLSVGEARIGSGFIAYGDRDEAVGTVYTNPPITPVLAENCG